MRMEQYLTHTDYALWEDIINGDAPVAVASASAGTEVPIPPKTAEQRLARKNELKARSTLLLAIPDEHLGCNDHENETVNTAHSVSATSSKDQATIASYADDVMFSFFVNHSNSPQLDNEDLEHIDNDDLEEMDLKWQATLLKNAGHQEIKGIGMEIMQEGLYQWRLLQMHWLFKMG
ncbi:hypothetical protein Tco_1023973 [Tanacetum coccineum]